MTQRRAPQRRSLITRAALIKAAAHEFAHHGYGDGSVNRALRETGNTKGALYFHFPSKLALAEAVLDEAEAIYNAIGERWRTDRGVGIAPVDAIEFMVRDAAHVYDHDMAVRAEARLTLEPEFAVHRPLDRWQNAVAELARRAVETDGLREGFTADKFARVLTTTLAGQRYMARVVEIGEPESIRGRYEESLDVVFAAAGIDRVAPHQCP
ncbi:TetR/AcrR family transcriptional regulator [Rhodococcoides fascians]|uniref:TetR/AcrR family transcriptional regulator n=1 Tax=Rhodococcoides fascians TaxID=1828 RepID=UPI00068CD9D6|nr:TetR/AcrR family transcriptional regulator [Rhodococcus fascians]